MRQETVSARMRRQYAYASSVGLASVYGPKVSEAVIMKARRVNVIESRRYQKMLEKARATA